MPYALFRFSETLLQKNHQLCSDLKVSMSNYNAGDIIAAFNSHYKRTGITPKTAIECHDSLGEIFEACNIQIKTQETIKRPLPNKPNKTESVGLIDIRTVNESVNLVIKVKYIKTCCALLAPLLKLMTVDSFNQLFNPNEKIILLMLTFGLEKDRRISEWIAIFYQNGNIVDTDYKTMCFQRNDSVDQNLKFNEKPILAYFKNVRESTAK